MDNDELNKILSKINVGKLGGVVLGHLEPIVDQMSAARLARVKLMYRSGKWDSALTLAEIGAICALDDLTNALKRQVAQGTQATAQHMEDTRV